MTLPFGLLLGCCVVLPTAATHFWDDNRNKALTAAVLGAPVAIYLSRMFPDLLDQNFSAYVSFLAFHGATYVVASGIHVAGDVEPTPNNNALLLAVGAVLASAFGTIAASMLLFKLLVDANGRRRNTAHTPLFFMLIVANCGGLLSAVGTPALFVGYLQGVPFKWLLRLVPYWFLVNGYLLTLFYFVDARAYKREQVEDIAFDETHAVPVQLFGVPNLLILAALVASVFLPQPHREIALFALAILSAKAVGRESRELNRYSYRPLVEFALLFAAIFITMTPALTFISAQASTLEVREPVHFLAFTGAVAALFNSVPAYLSSLSTAQQMHLPDYVVGMTDAHLVAISLGSVLVGATTYIGNASNMILRGLAREAGLALPPFTGYASASFLILTPIYLVVAILLGNP